MNPVSPSAREDYTLYSGGEGSMGEHKYIIIPSEFHTLLDRSGRALLESIDEKIWHWGLFEKFDKRIGIIKV